MRRGQQVLIGAHRRHAAAMFLHVGAGRGHRRAPAPRRGRPEWRCTAAGCPCPPTCTASRRRRSGPGPATAWARPVADSPIHNSMAVSRVCVKAKRAPSAEKPSHVSAGDGGSVTGARGAVGHRLQRQRPRGAGAVASVVLRVDAQAGQAQHRPRQLGNRRHRRAVEHRDDVARRAQVHVGRRRRVEGVDDRLRRQQVAASGGRLRDGPTTTRAERRGRATAKTGRRMTRSFRAIVTGSVTVSICNGV